MVAKADYLFYKRCASSLRVSMRSLLQANIHRSVLPSKALYGLYITRKDRAIFGAEAGNPPCTYVTCIILFCQHFMSPNFASDQKITLMLPLNIKWS